MHERLIREGWGSGPAPVSDLPEQKPLRAPAGLGTTGKRLWKDTTREWQFRPDELVLMRRLCMIADRIDSLNLTSSLPKR